MLVPISFFIDGGLLVPLLALIFAGAAIFDFGESDTDDTDDTSTREGDSDTVQDQPSDGDDLVQMAG